MTISFRIVETLGTNNMIIGLSDVRKYDLTTVFKHMYKYATEDDQNERKSNDPTNDPTYDQTTNTTTNVLYKHRWSVGHQLTGQAKTRES